MKPDPQAAAGYPVSGRNQAEDEPACLTVTHLDSLAHAVWWTMMRTMTCPFMPSAFP